mgnify:FL=1
MNKCIFTGRLVNDPEMSFYEKEGQTQSIAKYRLAINKRNYEEADFISVTSFGSNALFAEKYLKMGMKIILCAHVVTDSYINKNGQKIYTVDFIAESQEFTESKNTVEERQKANINQEEPPFK